MKKTICVILVALTVALTSCNKGVGLGNYEFTKIHIDAPHYSGCIEITRWYEAERGVEVKTKDFGNLFFSEGTYVMIEGKCPFCEGDER